MITRDFEVLASVGLHARPAAMLAEMAKNSAFAISIGRPDTDLINASSTLRMLTLKIKKGEMVRVSLDTDDQVAADEAFAKIAEFVAED
jgi:phosphocarrier protein HPr